ncbi:MAG: hypothetical protein COT17_00580, partial [Elusimicrobia bacterium CG08_land_8_20_14_0_20_51_18]
EYLKIKYYSQIKNSGLSDPGRYAKKITSQPDDLRDFNSSPVLSSAYGKLAWLSTRRGYPPSLILRDQGTGREKTLDYKDLGVENIPYSRFTKPLNHLAVSHSGRYLVFSAQKNHLEYLCVYDLEKEKLSKIPAAGFLEARQFSFSPDDSRLVFVGMIKGVNDLYEVKFDPAAESLTPAEARKVTDNAQDEASPVYMGDSEILYSCENGDLDDLKRELCSVSPAGIRKVLSLDGNIYDPVYDPEGGNVFFISDAGKVFDLYAYSTADGGVYRLTSSIGGVFTPFVSGNKVYFSYFRNGSVNLYEGEKENFLYTPVEAAAAVQTYPARAESADGVYKDYKFRSSTDLFFPAFMFSSPGGLFWMNYWQASDYLGYHNLSLYLNYNSAYPYFSSQFRYSYNRFRTKLFYLNEILTYNGGEDKDGYDYDRRYYRNILGAIYPFDRYNRGEFYLITKTDDKKYDISSFDYKGRNRSFQFSYVNDHINGLYLLATRGNRLELTWQKAVGKLGGNEKYDVYALEYLKYVPLSRKAVFVNRFFGAFSTGRDKKEFDFGGINGLRGFTRYGDDNENTRVLLYNAEFRIPLADMNYYMWYIFPDFYFKAMYLKLFSDNAYGWDHKEQFSNLRSSDIKNSVGIGLNFHTFVLQAFQMVLSFDYAVRTDDGGKIFYFYLGPLF